MYKYYKFFPIYNIRLKYTYCFPNFLTKWNFLNNRFNQLFDKLFEISHTSHHWSIRIELIERHQSVITEDTLEISHVCKTTILFFVAINYFQPFIYLRKFILLSFIYFFQSTIQRDRINRERRRERERIGRR